MNFLRKSLDKIKKPFGKGQKLEKFAPAFNAFDTLFPNITFFPLIWQTFDIKILYGCKFTVF